MGDRKPEIGKMSPYHIDGLGQLGRRKIATTNTKADREETTTVERRNQVILVDQHAPRRIDPLARQLPQRMPIRVQAPIVSYQSIRHFICR